MICNHCFIVNPAHVSDSNNTSDAPLMYWLHKVLMTWT